MKSELEIDFKTETQEGNEVLVSAKFELIEEYEHSNYWHIIALNIKNLSFHFYPATNSEYRDIEKEAKHLASKEAA